MSALDKRSHLAGSGVVQRHCVQNMQQPLIFACTAVLLLSDPTAE
jgi:hypothetical protein